MATREQQLGRHGLPPLGLEGHPIIPHMEGWMVKSALEAEGVLRALVAMGRLDPTRGTSILDWGSGFGSSTLALAKYAELSGSQLEAVDEDAVRVAFLRGSGILPAEDVHQQEGLAFLADAVGRGQSYDLVWAGFYHHDMFLARQAPLFVRNARRALSPGGQIVVYSDRTTMQNFDYHCLQAGIEYEHFKGQFTDRCPERNLFVISEAT